MSAVLRVRDLKSPLVNPLSLELRAGECLALSGPSGCGKTCLLRALADLDPSQGEVWLDGVLREEIAAPLWRRRVALLPARSAWWEDRVEDHFATPQELPLARLALAQNCLSRSIAKLSSGQLQRLALLRLLANQPRVLLLDEVTASLDPENVRRVEVLISEYCASRGAAAIWVSHDPQQISRVSRRQLVLGPGNVFQSGA